MEFNTKNYYLFIKRTPLLFSSLAIILHCSPLWASDGSSVHSQNIVLLPFLNISKTASGYIATLNLFYLSLLILFNVVLFFLCIYLYLQFRKSKKKIEALEIIEDHTGIKYTYFKTIFYNINHLTGLFSPEGEILSINPPVLDLFGSKEDEIVGLQFEDCPRWAKGTPVHKRMQRAIQQAQQGNTVSLELKCHDSSGNERIITFCLKPIFDKDNKLLYIVSEGHDISKLKETKKEIDREKKFTDAIVESLPGIFYVFNEKNELIRWNKNLEKHSGFSSSELYHKQLLSWFTTEDKKLILSRVKVKHQQTSTDQPFELRGVRKDGTNPVYLYSSKSITIDEKKYLIGTGFDISFRKKQENELQQTQKMEALGTLAGGIAHDFNNILSAIIGYTELSQLKTIADEQVSQYLSGIHQAAIRARDLVQQILVFSRKRDYRRQAVQIAPLVEEALRLVRSSVPSTISINADIDAKDAMVLADPTQIHQITVNLCTNGYQAIGDRTGILDVSLLEISIPPNDLRFLNLNLPAGEYVALRVSDNGAGIDKKDLQRIFEPYFTTKEKGKGTGLGLALVDSIVKGHGGRISVESSIHSGTTFTVYLPLLDRETAEPPQQPLQQLQTKRITNNHVVCVDDEPFILKILDAFLSDQGYITQLFTNGQDAIDYLKNMEHRIDIMITDQTMPGMTGLELGRECFRLRPQLPVILCTGYSQTIDKEKALQEGFKAYIDKPVILANLLTEIQRLVNTNI